MADVILARQQRRNAQSRPTWDLYASHRERVMGLLAQGTRTSPARLCVLGAGNCNDLDLPRLTDLFDEVHLTDLDVAALEFGVSQQGAAKNGRLQLHGPVDVTGVSGSLSQWTPQSPPSREEVVACVREANAAPAPVLPMPFDIVASVGLLTQLIESVALAIGERHPGFADLMLTVRNRHLRQMVEMVRPGGRLCLVTDVVSSSSFPELPNVPAARLAETLSRLIQQRNFFTGANPFVLRRYFTTDPSVCEQLKNVELVAPWLWNFGPRVYAVCAITAQRRRLDNAI
ncbi:MAG: hypothetical protein ACC628_06270 [Pirellulaceae bacterium]